MILDLSGSVGSDLPNLKSAANTFVDSLVGTPSRMAIFSFSADSPATGATQNFPNLTSVSTAGGATVVKNRYAAWTVGGGTNWDRGLATPAAAAPIYDVAVVITDGNPTNYSTAPVQGSGSFNRLREVENGIFSANALKAQGTRVIAFGVGAGVADANTGLNLRSISGPVLSNGSNCQVADYYQTTDYAAAGEALRALALGNCKARCRSSSRSCPRAPPVRTSPEPPRPERAGCSTAAPLPRGSVVYLRRRRPRAMAPVGSTSR
jgi:hypothetical protein